LDEYLAPRRRACKALDQDGRRRDIDAITERLYLLSQFTRMSPPQMPLKSSGTRTFALSVLFYVAAFAVLSWPWLSGAVTIPWDAKAQFQPELQFLASSGRRTCLPAGRRSPIRNR
jgi:hypothetical protein